MYRLTITREEQPTPTTVADEPGKRVRNRRKPVTRTALQMELSDEEYKALRPALLKAIE